MGKRDQVVASVIHEFHEEISDLESQAVRDSVIIYLDKLSARLADRLAAQDRGFDRAEFMRACMLAA
jgi:hypothetical protein